MKRGFLNLLAGAVFVGFGASLHGQPAVVPSADVAFDRALALVLGGSKSAIVDKRVGPIRAILTSHDESSRKLVEQAVAEINDAFGYGKIALSESERASIEDDALTIYVGSKSDGRQLVEDFGVSSPRAFGGAIYYYWWSGDRRNHIRRCLVAVDEALPQDRKAEDIKYMLLACMGFQSPWSARQQERNAGAKALEGQQSKFLSDLDIAIVRFFDKHLHPGLKAWEMRHVFRREWPDFSAAYWNPSSQADSENGSTTNAPSGVDRNR